MERYEIEKEVGSGNFGVVKFVRDKLTMELFAVKFIMRGPKVFNCINQVHCIHIYIDKHVEREIINHIQLNHPNVIRLKQVVLTPTHLAIVMEYAAGGELFDKIFNFGRFSENEARYFFQQLISGVSYCHSMQICHRDLKLENILLDDSTAPRVKICDFGYSKSLVYHSQPKTRVGTLAYVAPEALYNHQYDGQVADVWSCGVTLYVMLVGAYPFHDPNDLEDIRKSISRICNGEYLIPEFIQVSMECRHLLSRMFITNPQERIRIEEIKRHPWFLHNLAIEYMEGGQLEKGDDTYKPSQSIQEICCIIQEAKKELNPEEDGPSH